MKIGALVKQPTSSNAAYRALGPMQALGQQGHEIVIVKYTENSTFSLRELFDCDVVHVYRGIGDPRVLKCVAELWRRGIAITYDDDDDARVIPPDSPRYKMQYGGLNLQRTVRQQIALMAKADVVTTTTQTLADLFGKDYQGPTEVIENYLDACRYARDERTHGGVIIGWVASSEHMTDDRMLGVTAMLRNVMARDARIRVITIGIKLDLDPSRYNNLRRVEYQELSSILAQLDIGIAPLADHPMSYARSNVKVKEYAGAGLPWVASARGSYTGLGTNEGGITIADDRWEETLLDLAGSRINRMRLRRKAASWGKTQHIKHHTHRWERAMQTAIESAARRAA